MRALWQNEIVTVDYPVFHPTLQCLTVRVTRRNGTSFIVRAMDLEELPADRRALITLAWSNENAA